MKDFPEEHRLAGPTEAEAISDQGTGHRSYQTGPSRVWAALGGEGDALEAENPGYLRELWLDFSGDLSASDLIVSPDTIANFAAWLARQLYRDRETILVAVQRTIDAERAQTESEARARAAEYTLHCIGEQLCYELDINDAELMKLGFGRAIERLARR